MQNPHGHFGRLTKSLLGAALAACLGLLVSHESAADVSVELILKEGSPTSGGFVRSIDSVALDPTGETWAASVSMDSDPRRIAFVGVIAGQQAIPDILTSLNISPPSIRQVEFKSQFSVLSDGSIFASALARSGKCVPLAGPSVGFHDSIWFQGLPTLMEWWPYSNDQVWRSFRPLTATTDGCLAWIGSLGTHESYARDSSGVFLLTPTQLVTVLSALTTIPQLPAPLDHSQPVMNAALSRDGHSCLATVRLNSASPADRNEIVVRGIRAPSSGLFTFSTYFATSLLRKGSAVSGNGAPSATWSSFRQLGVAGGAPIPDGWFVSGTAIGEEGELLHLVVQAFKNQQAVVLSSGQSVSGEAVHGPFTHVAMNQQGDIAIACTLGGPSRRALIVNRRVVLKQGDLVPLNVDSNGNPLNLGQVTNILGQNNLAIAPRRADGSVAIYLVVNVEPHSFANDPGIVHDERIQALVRVIVPPQIVNNCVGDFNASGSITVQDIFDFLNGWFGGLPSADVNQSGAVTVQDIFDFLTSWFSGCV